MQNESALRFRRRAKAHVPMALYTFYPTRPDGLAPSFEAVECASDAVAVTHAIEVLGEHAAASHVVVWQGHRCVMTFPRGTPLKLRAAAGR